MAPSNFLPKMARIFRTTARLNPIKAITRNAGQEASAAPGVKKRTPEELAEYAKREMEDNWVSHGLHPYDKKRDKRNAQWVYMVMVGILAVPAWVLYYKRDQEWRDWSKREAYLVLREREAAGVLPVNRNYIDPAKLELPSDEELKNMDIVI